MNKSEMYDLRYNIDWIRRISKYASGCKTKCDKSISKLNEQTNLGNKLIEKHAIRQPFADHLCLLPKEDRKCCLGSKKLNHHKLSNRQTCVQMPRHCHNRHCRSIHYLDRHHSHRTTFLYSTSPQCSQRTLEKYRDILDWELVMPAT